MLNLEGAKSSTTGRAALFSDYSQMCRRCPQKICLLIMPIHSRPALGLRTQCLNG
jgi:hypothetical protein